MKINCIAVVITTVSMSAVAQDGSGDGTEYDPRTNPQPWVRPLDRMGVHLGFPLATVTRMLSYPQLKVLRIRDTGHTPFLCDAPLAAKISHWMTDTDALPRDSVHEPPNWPRRMLYPEN